MAKTVCFLTIDSVAEGVGRSQIATVLREVAATGWHVKLVSFEKDSEPTPSSGGLMAGMGVEHTALPFGPRGQAAGAGRLARLINAIPQADVYHCRSDIPFLAAYSRRRSPIVWDCRSLWAEQRAAAGLLSRSGTTYRALTLIERTASLQANGLITLSRAAVDMLSQRWGRIPSHQAVVPTVTDLQHFAASPLPPLDRMRACFSGSFGPNYDAGLAESFLDALATGSKSALPLECVWTSGQEGGNATFAPASLVRITTDYSNLPEVIAASHFGLVPIRLDTGISAAAMMPTKVGEFWASGRPIVVTRGVGDLDSIIQQHRVGVIIDSANPEHLRIRARELIELLGDPELVSRCRNVAEEYFDLSKGVDDLVSLYDSLL